MIILGIDPGTQRAGYGIIENTKHIASGVLTAPAARPLLKRLREIMRQYCELLDCNHVNLVAIEDQYCGKFPKAALSLGKAAGAFMGHAWDRGVDVEFYSPKEVKKAVHGGGACKNDVSIMVSAILGIPKIQEFDRADALAVALCCEARLALKGTKQ